VNDMTPSSPANDDTVEFQLSDDDMLGLSRAAEAAESQRAAPLPVAVALTPPTMLWGDVRHQKRKTIAGWAGAVAAYSAFMMFAWWGLPAIPDQQTAAVSVAKTPQESIHPVAIPASPAPAMVQVRNPFDATEVFEFPAGTSAAESREKVAEMLLKRASERRAQWARIKPKVSLRMAKN
jgi:hypothetical protein